MVTQLPGGWLAQQACGTPSRHTILPSSLGCVVPSISCGGAGAKLVNALNLGGQALFLLTLPAAASLGAVPLAVALTCLGMCQGPLVPAQAVLQRYWMPAGCVSTQPHRPQTDRCRP